MNATASLSNLDMVNIGGVLVSQEGMKTGNIPNINIPHTELGVYGITNPENYHPLTREDVRNLLQIAYNAETNKSLPSMEALQVVNSIQIRLYQAIPGNSYFAPVSGPIARKHNALGGIYIEDGCCFRMGNFTKDGKPKSQVVNRICKILEIKE